MLAAPINSRFSSTSAARLTSGVPMHIPAQNDRIEHPVGNGNDHARRTHNAQKSTGCSLRYAADADLAAKIGMPAVLHFQLLPDMGRMNG